MPDPGVAGLRVVGLDHVVLRVADAERSLRWYGEVLGLPGERVEEWRTGAAPFASLRVDPTTVIDLVEAPVTGTNVDHVALAVTGVDLEALAASGTVEVVRGPSRIWGAQGWGVGLYVADPDGHVIELKSVAGPAAG